VLHLRPILSDIEIFQQVWVRREYDIPLWDTPRTIMDLGANIGLASAFFAMKWPGVELALVEPEAGNYTVARGQPMLSQFSRPRFFKHAIGHEPGWVHIVSPPEDRREMSFRTVPCDPGMSAVESVTMPDLLENLGWDVVDLLKCDIEGAEDDLFCLNNDWLRRVNAVVCELHEYIRPGVVKRVQAALDVHGLTWRANYGENALFTRR